MRKILALLALSACRLPPALDLPDDQQMVKQVALDAWVGDGLKNPGHCIDRVHAEWADDDLRFQSKCKYRADQAAACVYSRGYQVGLRVYNEPYALLRPGQPLIDSTGGVFLHELMHIYSNCALGDADRHHSNPAVWTAVGGTSSVQWKARLVILKMHH